MKLGQFHCYMFLFSTLTLCNSGFGPPKDLVPPRTKSASKFGPPGPNLLADLVPLNYILADLLPPVDFIKIYFNISIVIYIVDFIAPISVELINHCM